MAQASNTEPETESSSGELRLPFGQANDELDDRLAAAIGAAELLSTRPDLPPDVRDVAAELRAAVEAARATVAQFAALEPGIAERKRFEMAALRLVAIVESSDDAIIGKTLEGIIVDWNRGAQRIYGYTAAEVLGRPISLLIPEDRPDELPSIMGRLRRGQRIDHYETERVTKDGRRISVSVTISPIRDSSGHLVGASAIARDISERKRAEREREALLAREQGAREEAEAAVRARDEFLLVAAHELRTPLTTLQAHVQLLLRHRRREGQLDPNRIVRLLGALAEQTDRLGRLINQLLDVTRIEAGRLTLERQIGDLSGLVERMVTMAQAKTDRHVLALDTPGPLPASVDPLRLEQVMANLLDNAIKYSPDGGPIEVALARLAGPGVRSRESGIEQELHPIGKEDGGYDDPEPGNPDSRLLTPGPDDVVVISVRDRGMGIRPEDRSRIFERFYQGHRAGYYSGMGLGLYISYQIVDLHGGELTAEFPEDGGTRFVVRIPTSPADDAPPPLC